MNAAAIACSQRSQQQGQALVEFLAIAGPMLALFLLLPMIGKYQDIAHATHMASRYLAFDATVHNDAAGGFKPAGQLADEVRRRYFSNPDAPIKTGDRAGEFDAHRNPLWTDPKGQPLIGRFSDVSLSFGEGNGTAHDGAFKSSRDGEPFNTVPLASHATLGLQARGIYRANVTAALANLPEGIQSYKPFDKIDLSITRQTSLLIDPWAARSAQQSMDRFGKLAPLGNGLAAVGQILQAAIALVELPRLDGTVSVSPPKFGNLQAWQDLVPEDRLKAGSQSGN